ncbi:hypothetical protein ABPG75_001560 [Micractinium tetrahymenae]
MTSSPEGGAGGAAAPPPAAAQEAAAWAPADREGPQAPNPKPAAAQSLELPVVPATAEALARFNSSNDPPGPAAPASGPAPGGDDARPDAAAAAAEAEAALGAADRPDSGQLAAAFDALAADDAARRAAVVASWARDAISGAALPWQAEQRATAPLLQQPAQPDLGPGMHMQQPDAQLAAAAAAALGALFPGPAPPPPLLRHPAREALGGGGRGPWHRVAVQEAGPDADYVLAGLPYAQEGERRHHLLKHELPDEARGMNALRFFGVDNVRQAVRRINKMAQRELQEMFQRVYGVRSSSNNNLWLRKKLIEAVNTRPRGGSSGPERAAPRQLAPEPARAAPAPAAAAAAFANGGAEGGAAGGDPSLRRRKKKGAPVRASDGLQADPNNAADALLALLGGASGAGSSDYESDGSGESQGQQAARAAAVGAPAAKKPKVDAVVSCAVLLGALFGWQRCGPGGLLSAAWGPRAAVLQPVRVPSALQLRVCAGCTLLPCAALPPPCWLLSCPSWLFTCVHCCQCCRRDQPR